MAKFLSYHCFILSFISGNLFEDLWLFMDTEIGYNLIFIVSGKLNYQKE